MPRMGKPSIKDGIKEEFKGWFGGKVAQTKEKHPTATKVIKGTAALARNTREAVRRKGDYCLGCGKKLRNPELNACNAQCAKKALQAAQEPTPGGRGKNKCLNCGKPCAGNTCSMLCAAASLGFGE